MLELQNISFDVESGTKRIINDINIKVDDNKLVVITGPNGGGKSTLSKIIMGIEKPVTGRILFNGQDITDLDITQRAKLGIGFAFQQPVRFKGLLVRDLIGLAAGTVLTEKEVCGYLSRVGLCAMDYLNRELDSSLSGGEMKRIEIAMLIARNVQLSIFDEPEAGIDLWSFHNLVQVFKKIRDEAQGTIIIVSHQERILSIADEIIVIADGAVTATGKREDILPQLLGTSDACEFYIKERV